jgi:predicted permease
MNALNNLIAGLKSLFQKPRVDRELEEELETYEHASAQHKQLAGMAPQAARRAARAEVGSGNAVKHQVWSSRWESAADNVFQDLRLALRGLWKSPGFTLIAVLSLALGIGANTAIFTLIHQVLLRSLPVQHPEQLVVFGQSVGGGINGGVDLGFNDLVTWDFARQLEANPGPFAGAAAYSGFAPLTSVRSPDASPGAGSSIQTLQLAASMVSDNYFSVLGATPLLGRTFLPDEVEKPGSSPVTVLSYHYWQQELGSDSAILGKTLSINNSPYRVIGVMRPGFLGIKPDIHPSDLYVPITMESDIFQQPPFLEPRAVLFLHMFARRSEASMADGVNGLKQDQAWLDQQQRDYIRAGEGPSITADRLRDIAHGETMKLLPGAHGVSYLSFRYGDALNVLMIVVVLVLLIACANLANFLLARGASRQREIATRLALGSSRLRIVRMSLVETLLLSLLGGALGLGLAFAATRALIALVTNGAEYSTLSPTPDSAVLLFTLGVSLVTGLLFGLGPAISTASSSTRAVNQTGHTQSLNSSSRGASSSPSARLVPKLLVTAQVMVALLLLVGAGLFLRSLNNLQDQDFGFERSNLLLVDFNPGLGGYTPDRMGALYQTILDRLESLPGVRSASISETPPISTGNWMSDVTYPTYTVGPKENMSAILNRISGHYFETNGVAIVAGRAITPADSATSPKVAVINQTLAKRYFPKGNPLGQILHAHIDSLAGDWQIVGVARDTRFGDPRDTKPFPMVYFPLPQMTGTDRSASVIEVRTTAKPANSIADLRNAFSAIDPNLPLLHIQTIHEQVDHMMTQDQLISSLTAIFASLALLLAAIGLYGVISYSVIRRQNEIGIRLALGAQTQSVLWLVLRESLLLLLIGVALGLPLTFACTRIASSFLKTQLFNIHATDPTTIAAAIAAVSAMTLIAAWLPARRAARIDPMQALRCD